MIYKQFSGSFCHVTLVLPQIYAASAKKAAVVGSFNKWDPTATPMVRQDQSFSVELKLPINQFYTFLYFVDGGYLDDLNADNYVPNPFGSDDAILCTYQVAEDDQP